MSRYLPHYWSLFSEFIDRFSSISYHNIPLPLLSNFYQYLSDDLKTAMHDPSFAAVPANVIQENSHIQPIFDRYMGRYARPADAPRPGKILINGQYHRLPPPFCASISTPPIL